MVRDMMKVDGRVRVPPSQVRSGSPTLGLALLTLLALGCARPSSNRSVDAQARSSAPPAPTNVVSAVAQPSSGAAPGSTSKNAALAEFELSAIQLAVDQQHLAWVTSAQSGREREIWAADKQLHRRRQLARTTREVAEVALVDGWVYWLERFSDHSEAPLQTELRAAPVTGGAVRSVSQGIGQPLVVHEGALSFFDGKRLLEIARANDPPRLIFDLSARREGHVVDFAIEGDRVVYGTGGAVGFGPGLVASVSRKAPHPTILRRLTPDFGITHVELDGGKLYWVEYGVHVDTRGNARPERSVIHSVELDTGAHTEVHTVDAAHLVQLVALGGALYWREHASLGLGKVVRLRASARLSLGRAFHFALDATDAYLALGDRVIRKPR